MVVPRHSKLLFPPPHLIMPLPVALRPDLALVCAPNDGYPLLCTIQPAPVGGNALKAMVTLDLPPQLVLK